MKRRAKSPPNKVASNVAAAINKTVTGMYLIILLQYTILHMQHITIYTTPTCVYCKMIKAFFKEHNVSFEEINVSGNTEAQEEMIKKSGQMGVPVIDIEGKIIVGFDQRELSEILGIK